ncbi:hypothetical protein [Paenibacillus polymyxa]|uniref:hypothetical protein n=1 Tax=Paenibacillus polymyxa TaxID=1406 RepID=UPI0001E314E9|nr:hypothetical protein [Paenibacillus polymyxa]
MFQFGLDLGQPFFDFFQILLHLHIMLPFLRFDLFIFRTSLTQVAPKTHFFYGTDGKNTHQKLPQIGREVNIIPAFDVGNLLHG